MQQPTLSLETIAFRMMTTGITMREILEGGWTLRKGKTVDDVRKAQAKAKKMGNFRIEYEIDWCETYLKDVLKKDRSKRA